MEIRFQDLPDERIELNPFQRHFTASDSAQDEDILDEPVHPLGRIHDAAQVVFALRADLLSALVTQNGRIALHRAQGGPQIV